MGIQEEQQAIHEEFHRELDVRSHDVEAASQRFDRFPRTANRCGCGPPTAIISSVVALDQTRLAPFEAQLAGR